MAMEVSCGNCSGRLLVETPGVIVVCPHCGIHLSIPEQDFSTSPENLTNPSSSLENTSNQVSPESAEERPANIASNLMSSEASRAETIVFSGSPSLVPKSSPVTDPPSSIFHSPEVENPAATPPENVGWLSSPNLSLKNDHDPGSEQFEETPTKDEIPASVSEYFAPTESNAASPNPELDLITSDTIADGGIETIQLDKLGSNRFDLPAIPSTPGEQSAHGLSFGEFGIDRPNVDTSFANLGTAANPSAAVETYSETPAAGTLSSSTADARSDDSISRLTFLLMIVGSYASLVTIVLIYLYFFGRAHQLESLPDLKTVQELGGRAAVPKPENLLPPGHDLRFGETQRYGNVRVTPLRVTRGPLTFEHQSGDKSEERSPSDPVLKLWLKFENVSTTEAITPLDTTLMFFHRVLQDHRVASYNAIFREADRRKNPPQLWRPFDKMAVDTEWLIVGQHTNQPLESLKSFETFIPSEEDIDGLNGELVWRVHFRKGYGRKTGNGVTTLIDVHFNSDDIKPDAT